MSDTWVAAAPAPSAVLGVVTETVADLDDTLWAARPATELLATVKQLEKLRSVLDAVELSVVAEIEATDAAAEEGWASTKDFVTAVSGGRKGAGRATVALARAVTTEHSEVWRMLDLGLISRPQAEVVVAAVDRLPAKPGLRDAAEQVLLTEARHRDASDLARAGRHVLERLDPEGCERREERALEAEERSAHRGRFLSIAEDGLGGVRLRGAGTVEDAAWIKNALLPLAAPQSPDTATDSAPGDEEARPGDEGCAPSGRDPREHGARMWDALVEACRTLAGTDVLPTSHGAPPRLTVFLEDAELRSALGSSTDGGLHLGTGLVGDGARLSAAAVRRWHATRRSCPWCSGRSRRSSTWAAASGWSPSGCGWR